MANLIDRIKARRFNTPAFIIEHNKIHSDSIRIKYYICQSDVKLLFAMKAMASFELLLILNREIDGYATSSIFEAMLAKKLSDDNATIHFHSPSISPDQIESIAGVSDYLIFNSITQLGQFRTEVEGKSHFGLRINPQLSFVRDDRYNPSRRASKLGVPLSDLVAVLRNGTKDCLEGVSGIHFHNNTDSIDFSQLLQTVERLDLQLGDWLSNLKWINLGGGYLFPEDVNLQPFYEAVDLLKSKHGLEVFIEPGAAIVRDAGFIVSSVMDIFKSDGKQIAVLDTTVNHMPEVFEYQYEPDVLGHTDDGKYSYILAGASCLAGDVFGEYAFNEPLEVGSRVVFTGMGAYTLVKANMFNGINLPSIYSLREDGELVLEKQFTYEDFASRCGVETHDLA